MRIVSAALVAAVLAVGPASAQMMDGHMMKKSLYERLGGVDAIRAVVDDFVANVAADKRINRFFAHTDIDRLKRNLVDQLCQGTGGPCTYTGRSMKEAHAGMGVRSRDFNALVGDLSKSLKKFKVPAREQRELVAILAPMKKDIVTRRPVEAHRE